MLLLSSLPDDLYERALRSLGGHILVAAPTCKRFRDVAEAMKRESMDRLRLPTTGHHSYSNLSGSTVSTLVGLDATYMARRRYVDYCAPLPDQSGDTLWAIFRSTKLDTNLRVFPGESPELVIGWNGHHPNWAGPNAWSMFRSLVRLPVGACFSFEVAFGRCGGDETKITLMGNVILRKSYDDDDMWTYCRWNGSGFVDLVASNMPVTSNRSNGNWSYIFHTISQLVVETGLLIFEDGKLLFEREMDPREAIPEFSVQHLTDSTDCEVFMRKPRVILAEGTEMISIDEGFDANSVMSGGLADPEFDSGDDDSGDDDSGDDDSGGYES